MSKSNVALQKTSEISFDNLPEQSFIRIKTIAKLYSVHTGTIWRWVKENQFPKPIKISSKVTCWQVSVIRNHLKKLAETNN